jgi:hypothetical protein
MRITPIIKTRRDLLRAISLTRQEYQDNCAHYEIILNSIYSDEDTIAGAWDCMMDSEKYLTSLITRLGELDGLALSDDIINKLRAA